MCQDPGIRFEVLIFGSGPSSPKKCGVVSKIQSWKSCSSHSCAARALGCAPPGHRMRFRLTKSCSDSSRHRVPSAVSHVHAPSTLRCTVGVRLALSRSRQSHVRFAAVLPPQWVARLDAWDGLGSWHSCWVCGAWTAASTRLIMSSTNQIPKSCTHQPWESKHKPGLQTLMTEILRMSKPMQQHVQHVHYCGALIS